MKPRFYMTCDHSINSDRFLGLKSIFSFLEGLLVNTKSPVFYVLCCIQHKLHNHLWLQSKIDPSRSNVPSVGKYYHNFHCKSISSQLNLIANTSLWSSIPLQIHLFPAKSHCIHMSLQLNMIANTSLCCSISLQINLFAAQSHCTSLCSSISL